MATEAVFSASYQSLKQSTVMNQYNCSDLLLSNSPLKTLQLGISRLSGEAMASISDCNHGFRWLFIEEGKGWLKIDQNQSSAQSGDIFILIPGEEVCLDGLQKTKTWLIYCHLNFKAETHSLSEIEATKELSEELIPLACSQLQTSQKRHCNIIPTERSQWLMRFYQIERELCDRNFGHTQMLRTLLLQLLIDSLRLSLAVTDKETDSRSEHPLIPSVFEIIEENYHQYQFSLSDVAKAVERSPAYLTDLVRRKTGKTVVNWIVEYRMREARRLLERTNQSVSQIAEKVGYEDTGYFSRQFRQLHGITPKAWRDRKDWGRNTQKVG